MYDCWSVFPDQLRHTPVGGSGPGGGAREGKLCGCGPRIDSPVIERPANHMMSSFREKPGIRLDCLVLATGSGVSFVHNQNSQGPQSHTVWPLTCRIRSAVRRSVKNAAPMSKMVDQYGAPLNPE